MIDTADHGHPVYVSAPTWRSFGNTYRVYEDRIELDWRLVAHTFVVRFVDLRSIDVFAPPVIRTRFWALKIDLADLCRHVGIERANGFMKFLRFAPDDPDAFVRAVARYWPV